LHSFMPMNIFTRLNWLDIFIIIIVMRISYVAFQDGLSHQIFPLIGTICTAVIALHYYHNIAVYIYQNAVRLPVKVLDFLSFVLLLIGIGLIFKLLRALSEKIINVTWHPLVERGGGLLLGFMRACVVTSVLLMIMALMPLSYLQHSIRDRSLMGMHFLRIVPNIYGKVSRILPTFKVETSTVDREDIVQKLAADKTIETKKSQ
jgi:uncharacterized membrane protein required for colicin V production